MGLALSKPMIVSMLIALSSMFAAAAPGSAAAPQVRTQAPGFYRRMLGDFEITALLDGTHPFPDAEVLTKAGPGVDSERSRLFENNPPEANGSSRRQISKCRQKGLSTPSSSTLERSSS
jgi:hypothetical protein